MWGDHALFGACSATSNCVGLEYFDFENGVGS